MAERKILFTLKTEQVDYPLDTQISMALQVSGLNHEQAVALRAQVLAILKGWRGDDNVAQPS